MSSTGAIKDPAQDAGSKPATTTGLAKPRIFAFIVGIDKWRFEKIPKLTGCVNDALAMQRFLTERLLVPDSHIKLLLNESATRQAILDTFQSHLIKNPMINHRDTNDPEIKPGDAIIFFYAGHGSRVPTPVEWPGSQGWPEIEGLTRNETFIETICPYDERMKDGNGRQIHGIPDVTLKILLLQLAASKGNNISVIFDSCYSGGMVRVSLPKDDQEGLARYTETTEPIPPDVDINIWNSFRAEKATYLPELKLDPKSTCVMLAACREEEVARETKISRGAFSLVLINLLDRYSERNALHRISYGDLHAEITVMFDTAPQHPHCEGKNMGRALFSGHVLDKKIKVVRKDGRLEVPIGSIHGVTTGAEFALEPPDSGVVLRADSVAIDSSILVPKDGDGDPQRMISRKATVSSWRNTDVMLKVFAEGLPKAIEEATFPTSRPSSSSSSRHSPTILMLKYERVASRDLADAWVVGDAAGNKPIEYVVTTKEPLLPGKEPFSHAIRDVTRLPLILDAIADFNFYLGYRNGAPEVTMGLFRLTEEGNPSILVPDKHLNNFLQGNKAILPNLRDAEYGISIVNRSERSLFPYVFYFNPADCSVQEFYHPPGPTMSAPLPACQPESPTLIRVGYGSVEDWPFRFGPLPEGIESDTGYLKLFVSTKYVDLHELDQAPFDYGRLPAGRVRRPVIDDWDALLASITVSRKL